MAVTTVPKAHLQILLDKMSVLRYKQEALDEHRPYNLFEVLRLSHDEVRLHSRVVADLLNPLGRHQLGAKPLESFLILAGIADFTLD